MLDDLIRSHVGTHLASEQVILAFPLREVPRRLAVLQTEREVEDDDGMVHVARRFFRHVLVQRPGDTREECRELDFVGDGNPVWRRNGSGWTGITDVESEVVESVIINPSTAPGDHHGVQCTTNRLHGGVQTAGGWYLSWGAHRQHIL